MTQLLRYTGPSPVVEASSALRDGQMILVLTEIPGGHRGHLALAAEHVTAASVHTMTTLGCGLINVAMRSSALDELEIPPADPASTGTSRDMFRVSVSLAGVEANGIHASQRARVIRALADPASTPTDFTRPGHVFPIGCAAGGVLVEPAAPEAGVDLVEQAGMAAAAALCEVCGADGELAGLPELLELAEAHELPVVSVGDLIAYRRRELCRVTRRGLARIPLPGGDFQAIGFTDGLDREHIALVHGDPGLSTTPLVRLHFECLLGDVLGAHRCACRWQLDTALTRIAAADSGALIYVRARSTSVQNTLRAFTEAADVRAAHPVGHSDLQSAFDILDDLGMRQVQLLVDGTEAYPAPEHVHVVARIPLTEDAAPSSARASVSTRATS